MAFKVYCVVKVVDIREISSNFNEKRSVYFNPFFVHTGRHRVDLSWINHKKQKKKILPEFINYFFNIIQILDIKWKGFITLRKISFTYHGFLNIQ